MVISSVCLHVLTFIVICHSSIKIPEIFQVYSELDSKIKLRQLRFCRYLQEFLVSMYFVTLSIPIG